MRHLRIADLPLEGLKLVTRRRVSDHRGYLSRLFCADELTYAGWVKPIAQVNHTFTAHSGTVRGMHFQKIPHAEMKCVNCIRGEVWDVAVDIRIDSPSFLRWHAVRLSADSGTAILIPEGFAHGFQALSDDVELIYFHSEFYSPETESGLNPLDPVLAITWPMTVTGLSPRDAHHPLVTESFTGMAK